MNFLKRILAVLLLFSGFILEPHHADAQIGWTKNYKNAVVVTAEKRASQVGKQILKKGGNAVDAAVAVQFALAVTLPRAGNIGGGGFMVIHLKDGTNTALDFREKAPHKASRNMYIRNGKYVPELSRESAIASGVPGVVDGMVKAIHKYGNLSLKTVMEPAIKLALKGYDLSWVQAQALNNHADDFKDYDASTQYFTKSNGKPYEEGEHFIQKDLAKTLERIAQKGRAGFYAGKTGDMIVQEMQKQDGIIDQQDLNNYKSIWRDPVKATFHGFNLYIMPPPSSGSIAIAQILDMLKPFDLQKMGFNSAKYVHLVTEVMRRAFADRAYFLGDPDYVNIPIQKLLSKSYNNERMDSFSWDRATSSKDLSHGKIPSFSESTQTTHFSIVDEDGNAVGVTTTLNGSFGNQISISGAGFFMNNEMDDFASKPGEPNMFGLIQGEANAIKPGKRMLSSMSPTIVTEDGNIRMVLGAAGGPRIITATFQSFLDLAVFGMNAQQAISAPRFHHQWMPDTLYYEKYGLSSDTRKTLESMGHHLKIAKYGVGRGHIIYVDDNGVRHGAPDPRGDGNAEGY